MTASSAIISTAPIVGTVLLTDDKALVTLPLALQFVAMAVTTIPASLYMGRYGRKIGFITGAFIGVCGGALGAYAIIQGDFVLFCIASLFTGSFNGFATISGSPQRMFRPTHTAARRFPMFWRAACWRLCWDRHWPETRSIFCRMPPIVMRAFTLP